MTYLKLILAGILAIGVPSAQAVTLEALMDAASENRDAVKAYQVRIRQQQASIREAKAPFLPRLDAGYTVNKLDADGLYETEKNHAIYGSLSWNVFAGFRDQHRLAAAKDLSAATASELQGLSQDIRLNVALAFLAVYRSMASLKVAEDAYALYKERHANVALKTKVGVLTKSDLLRIQVQMDQAELDVNRAAAAVRQAVNALCFETGTAVTADAIDFSVFETIPEIRREADCACAMLERHSSLQALAAGIRSAAAAMKAEKAAYWPLVDLSLTQTHTSDGTLPGSGDQTEDETRIQGKMTLNLYDGFAKYARIARARQEVARLKHQYAEVENQLKTMLKNRLLDAEVAAKNLVVANASVTSAEENLRVTDFSFQKGVSTSADLLDAIFYLSQARSSQIEAQTGLLAQDFQIRRLMEDL